jgi:AraC-like DNA-binding protein
VSKLISANTIKLYWKVAEQYGISRHALLAAAGLQSHGLHDPSGMVPNEQAEEVLRTLIKHAKDPALGLRLAHAFDLRAMGFWGYALLSSLTMRERIQIHLAYSKLYQPNGQASFRIEGGRAIIDFTLPEVPPDLLVVVGDMGLGITSLQLAKQFQCARPDVELWLTYPEQPHHRALRALVSGPVVFEAPNFRASFPEQELDRRLLLGDAHLFALAKEQLEAQWVKVTQVLQGDLLVQVRERLATRLASDASLESVAADLRISARTLRRRLNELGASFQNTLEEVRRTRAIRYLTETDQAIERVAQHLGYRDARNFRRAFRRWTGAAPADYRKQHRRASVGASERD